LFPRQAQYPGSHTYCGAGATGGDSILGTGGPMFIRIPTTPPSAATGVSSTAISSNVFFICNPP
jgi:hypothetical protein